MIPSIPARTKPVDLQTRIRRRLRKDWKRAPWAPREMSNDMDVLFLVFSLVLTTVFMVLGGVAAVGDEVLFRGGPPQGLGLG